MPCSCSQARPALSYLQVDKANLKGVLTALPKREEIPLQINEGLVIEHYTKYL